MKGIVFLIFVIIFSGAGFLLLSHSETGSPLKNYNKSTSAQTISPTITPSNPNNKFPLAIAAMRAKNYPGSKIKIIQKLADGANYHQYLTSYISDGLTIYSLLTIPIGQKPQGGWPAILLNHGYIPPSEYSTTDSYAVMVAPLASSGYVVFKPDFRGNGNSQGEPTQVYVSSDYVTDSLNAISSLKQLQDPSLGSEAIINPNKIGVLGHSMGGNVTLHELVIDQSNIKAAVILSGVVGSYSDILDWWDKRVATGVLTTQNDQQTAMLVQNYIKQHGKPQTNPDFWNAIDPTHFVQDISAPVQIHVGTADNVVPPDFSLSLYQSLKNNHKTVEFYSYPGADHNLSPDQLQVFQRGLAFFDKYLK